MAPFNYLEAIKLGVDTLHTAIPPLANGSAQPSIFNVARNAQALGYQPLVDLDGGQAGGKSFHVSSANSKAIPSGAQREYDHAQYLHQVPGGMISNLRFQLRKLGMENKMQETLDECGRVRAEFGYPIMVTPLAQFVGSQAAINVITGERYKEVTDQAIQYALGHWGKEAPSVMDRQYQRQNSQPAAREGVGEIGRRRICRLHEVRKKFGGPGVSDEELVLRVIAGEAAVKAMLAAGAPKEYLSATQPLVRLIGELTKRKDCSQVFIEKNGLHAAFGEDERGELQVSRKERKAPTVPSTRCIHDLRRAMTDFRRRDDLTMLRFAQTCH